MPRVSILMSSYNHERFVAEAIKSVLGQTFEDFEFIIVDDGSADRTPQEIRKFSDPRLKAFFLEKNQGAVAAKRKYLDEARGEFVSIFNSDDILYPNKLEKQVKFLDGHPGIGAVFSHAKMIDENGGDFKDKSNDYYSLFDQHNRSRFEWLNRFFYKGNCLCQPSSLIRKSCYESAAFWDRRFAQLADLDRWIKLCMKYEIHIIEEDLIKFRVLSNEANASGSRPETRMRSAFELTKILKNYLEIKGVDDFLSIFPTEIMNKDQIDDDLIPFFVAKLALATDKQIYQLFAVDTLYDLMGNEKMAAKLNERCGFSYRDLIKLTGENDLFNIVKVKELSKEIDRAKRFRFPFF